MVTLRSSHRFVRILPIVLILVCKAFGQSGEAALTIRFADGVSRFRVGEAIPIELSFAVSVANTYDMSTRNYDRSGRLNMEEFHVSPPGRDPLAQYYAVGAFIGGGLGGEVTLSSDPKAMTEDLNEWVALDKPGHYTVFVTSGRVFRRSAMRNEPIELRSNVLDFDVIPADPTWHEATLAAAASVLDSGSSTEDEKLKAVRILRFLDSPESVRELVRQMGKLPEGRRFDCIAGLAGSLHRALAVQELEHEMAAPDVAITGEYVYTLARLKVEAEETSLPPYPKDDFGQQKAWQERMQAYERKLTETADSFFEETASLVLTKRGNARAETVRTLLVRPAHGSQDVKPLTNLPSSEIATAFLALTADQQWSLLSTFWDRVQVPEMAEALEKIVSGPSPANQLLRSTAFERLFELDPAAATPYILEEIRHPHVDGGIFTVNIKALAVLPQPTLPDLDEMLASRLENKNSNTRQLDAQLIGRYSTKAILPRVKAVYEGLVIGKWDCLTEDGFMTYFLHVDPEYGVQHITPTTCMAQSVPELIKINRWRDVEPGMIAKLDSPELYRARDAAETLAKYGSPKAKAAMWARLRRFHQEWKSRERDLVLRANGPPGASDAVGFQFGLIEALARAQAWILSDEEVSELESLALGPERDNMRQFHWRSPMELNLDMLFDGQLRANINNQYMPNDMATLRAKLEQYPSGTKFIVTVLGNENRLASVLREVNDLAVECGLILEFSR